MKNFSLLFLLFSCNLAFAQADTTTIFISEQGSVTTRDSAFSYTKMYRAGNNWHGRDYYMKNNVLRSEGDYADSTITKPVGSFNNYTEQGKLDYTATYENGKMQEINCFYKNGSKRSWAIYDDKGIAKQKGWDESGREIKNFIVMRYAQYRGGIDGWNRYLKKAINFDDAQFANVLPGKYPVSLLFSIMPDGFTSKVKVASAPPQCKPCVAEALNVVRNSKEWEPAIRNNEPFEFKTGQTIVFDIPEKKVKK